MKSNWPSSSIFIFCLIFIYLFGFNSLFASAKPVETYISTLVESKTFTFGTAWSYSLNAKDPNKKYKLVVSGLWGVANGTSTRDAAFYNATTTPILAYNAQGTCDTYWLMDNFCTPKPMSLLYNSNHIYEYYLGAGKAVGYTISFTDGLYEDNSGSLTFDLYEITDVINDYVTYYPFTGNANDVKGTNNGVVNGATLTIDRFGNANSAYSFNGLTNYISATSNNLPTGSSNLTISMWVNYNACIDPDPVFNDFTSFLSYGSIGSGTPVRVLSYDVNQKENVGELIGTSTIPFNTWKLITYVVDGTKQSFYVDGVLTGQKTNCASLNTLANSTLYLGTLFDVSRNKRFYYLNGKLDDVRIYARALSNTEVLSIYNSESVGSTLQTGLVGKYSFSGNSNDESGSNNHLTNNLASFTTDRFGVANSAYAFNGTTSYLSGPTTLGNVTSSQPFSFSFWAKGATGTAISKYWNLDAPKSNFFITPFSIAGNGTNSFSLSNPNNQNWSHYVVVLENGTNKSIVYINGVAVTQGTLNFNASSTATNFLVGRVWGSPSNYFNGSIDDIQVFNRVLTAQEAKAIYDLESVPAINNPLNLPVATISTNLSTISEVVGSSGSTVIAATLASTSASDVKIDVEVAGTATYDSDYAIDFTKKGKGVQVAGSTAAGAGLGDLSNPLGVTLDQAGNIYIADGYNHRIVKWTKDASTGTLVAGGNGQGSAANQFSVPNGVAVDRDGNIFVSDYSNNRIQKWAKNATTGVTILGGNGVGDLPNQIIKPVAICVDSSGNVYVADSGNNRIQKWIAGNGNTAITVAGGNGGGSALNQLAFPIGVKVDQSGNIYVAENGNHRVTKWLPGATQGIVVAGGNGGGLGLNQFSYPQGLGLDLLGNIYVSDYQTNSVKKWAPGATAGVLVAGPTVSGNFVDAPYDMEADRFGNLFIVDNRDQRIFKLQYQPQIVIPAGQLTGNLTVTSIPDQLNESDENIVLTPTNKNYYYAGLNPVNITLKNTNTTPTVSFTASNSTIAEAGGSTVITATLNAVGSTDVTVGFTASGTAILNTDYKSSVATITIPAGQLSATFTITGINDLLNEDTETIVLTPSNVINGTAGSGVTINITSEDLPPSILFGLSSSNIDEEGSGITLTARLSNRSSKPVTIALNPTGTAVKNVDYTFSAESITISAGDSLATVTINPVNDSNVEIIKTIIVGIATSTNASTSYPSVTANLISGDNPTVAFSTSTNSISEFGGTATITATLSAAASKDATIGFSSSGTATFNTDFQTSTSILTIPAGQTSATFVIASKNDLLDEVDETIILTPGNLVNAIAGTSVTITLISDDSAPTLSLGSSSTSIYENLTGVTVNFRLSNRSSKTITAQLGISGTASKGIDYTLGAETVTFAPLDSIVSIQVTPINDAIVEPVETIVIAVNSATNVSSSLPAPLGLNLISEDISLVPEVKPNLTVTANQTTLSEANGSVTLTATLSEAISKDVNISFTKAGTATFDADYISDFTGKAVGQVIAGKGGTGSDSTQLNGVRKVLTDPDGKVWVMDRYNARILKINPNSGKLELILLPSNIGSTRIAPSLTDFSISNDGYLYIADADILNKYDLNGKLISQVGNLSPGPRLLYISSINKIYYLDFSDNIYRFDPITKISTKLFALGSQSNISPPLLLDFAVDASENIYIAGRSNYYKVVNGIASQFGMNASLLTGFSSNPVLSVLDNGNVILSTERDPTQQSPIFKLHEVNSSGKLVKTWLDESNSPYPTEFAGISSIAKSSTGDLFVGFSVDANNLGTIYAPYVRNKIFKFPFAPQLVIKSGQKTGTLQIKGVEDLVDESNETINLTAVADNATVTSSPLSLTLVENRITLTRQFGTPFPTLSSSASSWGDFDRDGDQDLAIMGLSDTEGIVTRIYRNDAGKFINTNQNLVRLGYGDIKWVDINKDGYLDLFVSGSGISGPRTALYLNEGGRSFIESPNTNVENLSSGKIAFGDLDNDGDLDLAIMGLNAANQPVFNLYDKTNGVNSFTKIPEFSPPVASVNDILDGDLKIADFDYDGDNDLLFKSGYIKNSYSETGTFNYSLSFTGLKYEVTNLFNTTPTSSPTDLGNTLSILAIGNNNGTPTFQSNKMVNYVGGTLNLKDGAIAVGDYNNDGLNDILVTGINNLSQTKAYLYNQLKDNTFELSTIAIEGLSQASANWVDYDVDGDLDLFMTGLDNTGIQQTIFYKNDVGTKKNSAPAAPTNLKITDIGGGFVKFTWDKPSDDYSIFLGYNIRLGTTDGGTELSNTQSNLATGSRLITEIPPIYATSYITQLKPGKYYWSVQAIDQGFQGSPFATTQAFALQYEWKLVNQKGIVNRSIAGPTKPKMAMLDIDNDKDLDLIVGSETSRDAYLYDNGIYKKVNINIGLGGIENIVAGDINNDGLTDLVINTSGVTKDLNVLLNIGGNFKYATATSTYTPSFTNFLSSYSGAAGLVSTKLKILDIDNDGFQEIMMAGITSSTNNGLPKFYRFEFNKDSTYTYSDLSSQIFALKNASYDFGDFNKDKKVDFIISGFDSFSGLKSYLYKNMTLPGEALNLTATSDNLVAVDQGTSDFIDYDGDGDLDIMFTGRSVSGDVYQLYENRIVNGQTTFIAKNMNLDPIRESKLTFGDFDGDGYKDILYTGLKVGIGKVTSLAEYNLSQTNFVLSNFSVGNLIDSDAKFGDIDFDGDLDMLVSGKDSLNVGQFKIFLNVRNESATLNLLPQSVISKSSGKKSGSLAMAPQAFVTLAGQASYMSNSRPTAPYPSGLSIQTVSNIKSLEFKWNASTDDHTPVSGLTYNLRIGTTQTNDNILASNASADGILKIPVNGNAEANLSWAIKMLPDGVYYWSVQSVDASFAGSSFSTPRRFEITNANLVNIGTFASAAPVATNGNAKISSGIIVGGVAGKVNVTDPEGDPLTYSIVSGDPNGWFQVNAAGEVILKIKPGVFPDAITLGISVSDGTNNVNFTYSISFCETNFEISETHLNQTKVHKSTDYLRGTSKIQGSSNVEFQAPKSIELKPGFVAEKGTIFKATVGIGCSSN